MAVRREARILPDVARIVTCQAMEILTAYILGIMVHQATDIVTAYVIGIVICQAMKIAGTHVGKIAIYEETAGREHYGMKRKIPVGPCETGRERNNKRNGLLSP